MNPAVTVRRAVAADAPVLAHHRVAMFRDMGTIQPAAEAALRDASAAYFTDAVASGEYVAWLAASTATPGVPIAGAGVQFRPLLPRPDASGVGILLGREGLVLNVYTELAWRRRGVARRLMEEILAWAPTAGVVRLVLHASTEGRMLYETLGFQASNEMRYTGSLAGQGTG
jgi:GNAT superfamily N-acetyltransferase